MRGFAFFVYYAVCLIVWIAVLWGERTFLLSMGKEFIVGFASGGITMVVLIAAWQKLTGKSLTGDPSSLHR
jgi:hypothetical protein